MKQVKIDTGYITGAVLREQGREVTIYRSIPYAAPPVGDLRWKPPQPAVSWSGVRECVTFCKAAPASSSPLPGTTPAANTKAGPRMEVPQSEDCLYLNVLTPARSANEKLPVMVWMHGGGYIFGSANESHYNLARLPAHGVVLVNINMRLGPIGLLANRLLSAESPEGVSGNYMFLDMIAGLKWVQRNIAAFGGDPDNVTIFGESGGAAKVITLMASPLTRGLFRRVIAESACPDGRPLADLEATGEKFFAKLGVARAADPLKAARALPWEKIIEAEKDLIVELHSTGRGGNWDIAIDNWFMKETPLDAFKNGRQHPLPYMMVANLGELSTRPGAYLIPAYLGLLSGAAKTSVKAHAIIFDGIPARWKKEGCFSFHAIELGYVFGDWDNSGGFWTSVFMMASSAGAKSRDPGLTEADRTISEMMMTMWTRYAADGEPAVKGLIACPVWNDKEDRYLFIDEHPVVKSGYSQLPTGPK